MRQYLLFCLFLCTYGANINVQPLSQARQNIASASLSTAGIGMFAGGFNTTSSNIITPLNAVDIYNVNTNSWSTAKLSVARYDIAAASLPNQGLIYFAGGVNNSVVAPFQFSLTLTQTQIILGTEFTDIIDIYNANTNSWSIDKLSEPKAGIMTAVLPNQGIIFFAGGEIAGGYTKKVEIFNTITNQKTYATLSVARGYSGATSLYNQGLVFFAGGLTNKNPAEATSIIDIYDYNKNTWTTALLLSQDSLNFYLVRAFTFQDKGLVYFQGGVSVGSIYQEASNTKYTYSQNLWSNADNQAGYFLSRIALIESKNLLFFISGASVGVCDSDLIYNLQAYRSGKNYAYDLRDANIPRYLSSSAVLENQGIVLFAGGLLQMSGDILVQTNLVTAYGVCDTGTVKINPLTCTSCPAGYFCPYSLQPIICPIGSFCPPNSRLFTPCPIGTHSTETGLTSQEQCVSCPAGTSSNERGSNNPIDCVTCTAGYYCPERTGAATACPMNNYCPTTIQKIPCPAGTFFGGQSATSINSCAPCPFGNYCPVGQSPIPCTPGTYSDSGGLSSCKACPEGYSCPLGSTKPQICPMQFFSSSGQASCTPCASGEYTLSEGTTSCIICPTDNIKGWSCSTQTEKIVFVFITIGSIVSGCFTAYKSYNFYTGRSKLLRENGVPITIKHLIKCEKAIKKHKKLELIDVSSNDQTPILQADEIKNLKETIAIMQTKIAILES